MLTTGMPVSLSKGGGELDITEDIGGGGDAFGTATGGDGFNPCSCIVEIGGGYVPEEEGGCG